MEPTAATQPPALRFAAIGLNHNHINGQTNLLLRAGAQLTGGLALLFDQPG